MIQLKTTNYQEIDWKDCHEKLTALQARLVEAYRANNARAIKDLQRSIVTSFAGRAMAVRTVITNKGGYTPSVDGIKWDSVHKKINAIKELHYLTQNPGQYKAKPVIKVQLTTKR